MCKPTVIISAVYNFTFCTNLYEWLCLKNKRIHVSRRQPARNGLNSGSNYAKKLEQNNVLLYLYITAFLDNFPIFWCQLIEGNKYL